ncbi:hypothetical protein CEXT_326221 [Caerostris extrusa]|uniref:Uncharacterized protein n=1 Tax=Caerostris extrusa TaxID=172846 RepID=A0AAV4RYW2_CAEEX|nr:hypothetical protein CEXT_326221 [Caerostris extrusa]
MRTLQPHLINHGEKCFLKAIKDRDRASELGSLQYIFGFRELRLKNNFNLALRGGGGFDWLDSLSLKILSEIFFIQIENG